MFARPVRIRKPAKKTMAGRCSGYSPRIALGDRHEGDERQKELVEPQQPVIVATDVAEDALVRQPVDGYGEKAHAKDRGLGPQSHDRRPQLAGCQRPGKRRHPDPDREQGERKAEHAVAQIQHALEALAADGYPLAGELAGRNLAHRQPV
jgi:hypothetical protein